MQIHTHTHANVHIHTHSKKDMMVLFPFTIAMQFVSLVLTFSLPINSRHYSRCVTVIMGSVKPFCRVMTTQKNHMPAGNVNQWQMWQDCNQPCLPMKYVWKWYKPLYAFSFVASDVVMLTSQVCKIFRCFLFSILQGVFWKEHAHGARSGHAPRNNDHQIFIVSKSRCEYLRISNNLQERTGEVYITSRKFPVLADSLYLESREIWYMTRNGE